MTCDGDTKIKVLVSKNRLFLTRQGNAIVPNIANNILFKLIRSAQQKNTSSTHEQSRFFI